MTAPRLIRLVPTGEAIDGIELVEPEEVQPLSEEQIMAMARDECADMRWPSTAVRIARMVEQAHGIGRRLDA